MIELVLILIVGYLVVIFYPIARPRTELPKCKERPCPWHS